MPLRSLQPIWRLVTAAEPAWPPETPAARRAPTARSSAPGAQGHLSGLRRRQDAAARRPTTTPAAAWRRSSMHASARRCSIASSRSRPISIAWYADFNVIFTLTRPTSGSSTPRWCRSGGGAWCSVDAKVAGVAPFLCKDLHGGVAYTFDGGANAHETAVDHRAGAGAPARASSTSPSKKTSCARTSAPNCDGFKNQATPVTGDRCDRRPRTRTR